MHGESLNADFCSFMRLSSRTAIIALVFLAGLSSCITRPEPSHVPSEGMPGEVLVVSDEDNLDEVKSAFETHFKVFDPILLVAENADERRFEKTFSFWYGRSQSWEGSEKTAPLILIFGEAGKYSSDLTKRHPVKSVSSKNGFSMQVFKDVWGKPQTVVRLRYGRDMNAEKILAKGGDREISDLLLEFERNQGFPGNLATNAYTDSVSRLISRQYGFGFAFPPQFRLVYSNSDVIWLQQETGKFYRHIFINIFSDSLELNQVSAIENRNYFTRKYIRNEEGTSTLVSRSELFPMSWKKAQKTGKLESDVLRGWYQEEGTFRRGPFVRYIFHDKANRRYIALDGFVFAPDMDRQPFYRLFDHIANSFYLQK